MSQRWMEDPVMGKMKRALLARLGEGGFKAIAVMFRTMDTNRDQQISPQEFTRIMQVYGVVFTPVEINHLIKALDTNGDGNISVDEFVKELSSGLNTRRKAVVMRAWRKFDKTGDNQITLDDLRGTFNAKKNPAVLKGEKTEEQIMTDFLKTFDDATNPDGVVTQEEFFTYYAGVSANLDNDDHFEALIIRAWDLEPVISEAARKQWGSGDFLSFGSGPQTAEECYSKTIYKKEPWGGYNNTHMRKSVQPPRPNGSVQPNYETTMKSAFVNYDEQARKLSNPVPQNEPEEVYSTGNAVLDGVRKKVLDRGGKEGFLGLSRIFRIFDTNRTNTIDKTECLTGFQRYGIKLSPLELDTVFQYFDTDRSGELTLTEFLRGLRGPLTKKCRVAIVLLAFERLDKNGSGTVTLDEIASAYDTTKHPAVLAKIKTKEQVLKEFVADWDRDGNSEITREEFLEYYANLSAGVDDDQYFELMVRNAWHISGGVGVAANTSCRRVLVTFKDSTQRVLEIVDDLGIRKDNKDAMIANLNKQGFNDIERIDLAF